MWSPSQTSTPILTYLAATLCSICVVLSAAALFRPPSASPVSLTRRSHFPRPNQFIGLEALNHSSRLLANPLINHAPLLTQVSEAKKDYVFPDDSGRFKSKVGMVSPEDRHFVVTNEIHTIGQFRVLDFDYEDCQVIVSVPTQEVLNSVWWKSISLSRETVSINIWRLNADEAEFLDPRELSWNTRPKRADSVPWASLIVGINKSAASDHFPCHSDEILSFEFGCEGAGCAVDFWQDGRDPLLAVYALQHMSPE